MAMTGSREAAEEPAGGVAAVDRALAILDAVGASEAPLALAELSRRTGFYKSTILRLSESLERAGHLRRNADGRFTLGPELLRLGKLYQRSFRLEAAVMPVLRRLASESRESAALYVRDGNERLCLLRVESPESVRDTVQEGDRRPLDRGAAGRILLAFASRPPADSAAIRTQLFAASFGEVSAHTAAIAAPVFGVGQELVGALNLSGPLQRFTPDSLMRWAALLRGAAAELTRELGGQWPKAGKPARAGAKR